MCCGILAASLQDEADDQAAQGNLDARDVLVFMDVQVVLVVMDVLDVLVVQVAALVSFEL